MDEPVKRTVRPVIEEDRTKGWDLVAKAEEGSAQAALKRAADNKTPINQ